MISALPLPGWYADDAAAGVDSQGKTRFFGAPAQTYHLDIGFPVRKGIIGGMKNV